MIGSRQIEKAKARPGTANPVGFFRALIPSELPAGNSAPLKAHKCSELDRVASQSR
jgi:hypothetical protein